MMPALPSLERYFTIVAATGAECLQQKAGSRAWGLNVMGIIEFTPRKGRNAGAADSLGMEWVLPARTTAAAVIVPEGRPSYPQGETPVKMAAKIGSKAGAAQKNFMLDGRAQDMADVGQVCCGLLDRGCGVQTKGTRIDRTMDSMFRRRFQAHRHARLLGSVVFR